MKHRKEIKTEKTEQEGMTHVSQDFQKESKGAEVAFQG